MQITTTAKIQVLITPEQRELQMLLWTRIAARVILWQITSSGRTT